MSDGGFVVKIGDSKAFRCYKISFDYDTATYQSNEEAPKEFNREDIKRIEITLE